jgi:hypothetical protein
LEGNAIKITDTNLTGLEGLCGELGFTDFAGKLSEFRSSTSVKEVKDADARGRIAALAERVEAALHRFFGVSQVKSQHCGQLQRKCGHSPERFLL